MIEAPRSAPLRRYPALRLLERQPRRRSIPFMEQLQVSDCGAACLAMVLGYHGRESSLDEVRDALGVGRDGVSSLQLLEAGRAFGLRGRGIRLELEDLQHLKVGTILHWDMRHFVVFERVMRQGVWIVDPAIGRRRLPIVAIGRHFTGVALEFEPSGEWVTTPRRTRRLRQYVGLVFRRMDLVRRVALASLFLQVLTMAIPIFTGALVDKVIPRADYDLLVVLCGGLAALALFGFLTHLVRGYLLLQLRTDVDVQMTTDLVEHLTRLPLPFFQARQTGDLVLRLGSTNTIREILTSSATSIALDGSLVLGYLILLLFLHFWMGLLVLMLCAARIAVFLVTRGPNARWMAENLHAQAAAGSFQVQMIQGIETLKSAGAEPKALERWSHLFAEVMNISIQRGRIALQTEAFLQAMNVISPAIILGFGGYLVLEQKMSLGTMLAISALAAGVLGPLSALVSAGLQAQVLGSYIDRVDDVLRAPVEQPTDRPLRSVTLRGGIRMEKVSFRYTLSGPLAIDDVSLRIQPGQIVAIVGPSGSGKSTLARLLIGLYQPTRGRVLLDDTALGECDLRMVRRQIGFVPQVTDFFDASIRENIDLSDPGAPLEEIERAARQAWIHEEIEAMPLGYETPLASNGGTVSGGQRQRIALARALLGRPKLLILDEATSHLDAATERRVYENLTDLKCTRIIIAHRLSTIASAENILVMDQGRLAEQGTHDELLAAGGVYSRLVVHQCGG